ncbi:YczE/YyaS/YitT family protein [Eubacterium sp.]
MLSKINEIIKKGNYFTRITIYILGLFIMTLGISMSVKSDFGVSPVSSIPYTITCITGLEMGKATILFHVGLVVLQIIILRKAFKIKNLLQVVVGVIFGYFTTFSNYLFSFLPQTDNIAIRTIMMVGSAALIAVGIFFYLPADIVPLAGEGAMQAIADKINIEFSKVKMGFDISMVAISLITCLIVLKALGSVGIGTIVAAVLVGAFLGLITKMFGEKRDNILLKNNMNIE